jgi:hypothetical protein
MFSSSLLPFHFLAMLVCPAVRLVFLSVSPAQQNEIYEGPGTPLPDCAELPLLLATAAPVLGVDAAFLLEVDPSS